MDEGELTAVAARACMAGALEPIGRGNNDGKIHHRGYPGVAVDCFGHEGNAEFLSHAQRDVLALVDEVRRLRSHPQASPEARAEPSKPLNEYPTATDETVCENCGERGHWWCRPSRVRFVGRARPNVYPEDVADDGVEQERSGGQ